MITDQWRKEEINKDFFFISWSLMKMKTHHNKISGTDWKQQREIGSIKGGIFLVLCVLVVFCVFG